MWIYGPANISFNGTALGKTHGGVSLSFDKITYRGARTRNQTDLIVGGNGVLHMFQWNNSITISNNFNATLGNYANLVITTNNMNVSIPFAKLSMPGGISLGQHQQESFDVEVSFKRANNNANVFTLT